MDNVSLGLAGYGFIGRTHAIAYKTMGITTPSGVRPILHTLCSTSVKEEPDFVAVTSDYQTLLDEKEISAVDICTPDFLHFEQGMAAMAHRKHVYIEKPIGRTLEEARLLAKAAGERGLVGQTALVMRFQPKVVAARDLIASGEIGEVIRFKAHILNNAYLDPGRPVNWRLDAGASAGGSLMDTGVHVADLVRFLLGEVAKVSCETSLYFKERFTDESRTVKVPVHNDEWSVMQIELEDGVRGELETSRIAAGVQPRNYFEIFGSKGYLHIDLLTTGFLRLYRYADRQEHTGPFGQQSAFAKHLADIHPAPMFDMGCMVNTHSACAMNFLFNVAHKAVVHPESPTLLEAWRSQRVIDSGYRSARQNGRWVEIDKNADQTGGSIDGTV